MSRYYHHPLSKRELEVLRLVVTGQETASVAQTLYLQPETIKFHLANIYRKLGAQNRTQAVWRALEEGLIAPPSARDRVLVRCPHCEMRFDYAGPAEW